MTECSINTHITPITLSLSLSPPPLLLLMHVYVHITLRESVSTSYHQSSSSYRAQTLCANSEAKTHTINHPWMYVPPKREQIRRKSSKGFDRRCSHTNKLIHISSIRLWIILTAKTHTQYTLTCSLGRKTHNNTLLLWLHTWIWSFFIQLMVDE